MEINHHWVCAVSPKDSEDQANKYVLSSWVQELDWSPRKLVDVDLEVLNVGKADLASSTSSWGSAPADLFCSAAGKQGAQFVWCVKTRNSLPAKVLGEVPCKGIKADCRVKCSENQWPVLSEQLCAVEGLVLLKRLAGSVGQVASSTASDLFTAPCSRSFSALYKKSFWMVSGGEFTLPLAANLPEAHS